MWGIFKTFPRVERNLLLAMNLFYELNTASAAAIARRSEDVADNIIQGRNLDLFYPVVAESKPRIGQNATRWVE